MFQSTGGNYQKGGTLSGGGDKNAVGNEELQNLH